MTVHFIGAGPGAPDLITVRGLKFIQTCPVCLYAGSLVPKAVVAEAPENACVINTADMALEEIISVIVAAEKQGNDVARVHSGDTSLYSAMNEQMRRLDQLGIAYDVTPGVPAFAAAAAILNQELTIPGVSQTVVLSRTQVNSTPMPENETLKNIAQSRATLVLHLSLKQIRNIRHELRQFYGDDCPVVIAARIGWPDQLIIRGTLANIEDKIIDAEIKRTAIIFIGRAMNSPEYLESMLYSR